jgi:hypothetical protein
MNTNRVVGLWRMRKRASKYSTLESDSRRRARESSKYVLKGNKLSYILLGEVFVKSQENVDVK